MFPIPPRPKERGRVASASMLFRMSACSFCRSVELVLVEGARTFPAPPRPVKDFAAICLMSSRPETWNSGGFGVTDASRPDCWIFPIPPLPDDVKRDEEERMEPDVMESDSVDIIR